MPNKALHLTAQSLRSIAVGEFGRQPTESPEDVDTTVKLPNAENAITQKEKLQDYLLSQSHPIGRFKAAFFRSLGYSSDNWEALERDIRNLLSNEVEKSQETEYGNKFEVRGEICGPSGLRAKIVTVWIVRKGNEFPRFITAYPGEK